MLACVVTIVGLEFLYRRTLIGRAFLAIAEDSYAARALGLPETRLRLASYAIAGMIGTLAGFTGAQMLLAFFGNQAILNFYGFVPVALGGMGSNRGAVIGGLALGLFQQAANFLVGGIFAAVAVFAVFIVVLLLRPEGLAGAAAAQTRMRDAVTDTAASAPARAGATSLARQARRQAVVDRARAGRPAAAAARRLLHRRHRPARLHLLDPERRAEPAWWAMPARSPSAGCRC